MNKTPRSIWRRRHDDGCRQRGELSSSLASFCAVFGPLFEFQSPRDAAHERPGVGALHGDRRAVPRRIDWPDQDADQVQVQVRVPPGQPLGRARQEQWLRAREKRCARRADTKNIAHGVCASGQPHPQRPPNDNGPHYFRCKRPQKRPKEQGRFVWR